MTTTTDAFLGGRVMAVQPAQGYRAGVDPVLLAASVPALPGQKVLELGCGVGVASLCLAARVPGVLLSGVEIQAGYACLARQNATLNGVLFAVHTCDLRDLPPELRGQSFDHVIANPPYFQRIKGTRAPDSGREIALAGETLPGDWLAVAARRLAPKGYLTFIQDVRRLPEMLSLCPPTLGSIEIWPIAARSGRAPHSFLMRARKGGRADFRLHPALIMHVGDRHERDGDSYTTELHGVLREGKMLSFPGS